MRRLARILSRSAQGLLVLGFGAPLVLVTGLLFFPAAIDAFLSGALGVDPAVVRASIQRAIPTRTPRPAPTPPSEFDRAVLTAVPLPTPAPNSALTTLDFTGKEGVGGPTQNQPYGYALNFINVTAVAVVRSAETNPRTGHPDHIWIAVVVPGDELSRVAQGRTYVDFDGSQTPGYSYRGFTAWLLLDENILTATTGSQIAHVGLGQLVGYLKPGSRLSVIHVSMNAGDPFRAMNHATLDRLAASVGKPHDRADQTFLFKASQVVLPE